MISPGKGKSRLEQVIEWVGGPDFDGAIIFDEAHKVCSSAHTATALPAQVLIYVVIQLSHRHEHACCHTHKRTPAWQAKNFVPGAEGKSTKVSATVLALQEQLPKARIVYCSATGVSESLSPARSVRSMSQHLEGPGQVCCMGCAGEQYTLEKHYRPALYFSAAGEVGNMAYMSRLGLWGAGSAFDDFEAFLDSMKKRGVSFLEMLVRHCRPAPLTSTFSTQQAPPSRSQLSYSQQAPPCTCRRWR